MLPALCIYYSVQDGSHLSLSRGKMVSDKVHPINSKNQLVSDGSSPPGGSKNKVVVGLVILFAILAVVIGIVVPLTVLQEEEIVRDDTVMAQVLMVTGGARGGFVDRGITHVEIFLPGTQTQSLSINVIT